MPLYEYQCKKCKHRFDRIQKFSDPILRKCPECGGVLERLISAPAVRFKGTGWYVTDYPRKGAGKSASGDGAEGKEGKEGKEIKAEDKKGEGKTEAKPRHETAAKKSPEKKT